MCIINIIFSKKCFSPIAIHLQSEISVFDVTKLNCLLIFKLAIYSVEPFSTNICPLN